MDLTTKNEPFEQSSVTFLPFINSPPSNYSTIYSALDFALHETEGAKKKICIITFDQPLYMKAREITASLPEKISSRFFIRLGGFHLLMSFMGAIGFIMAGSGLKELLCTIFACNSVDKILSGHAFARGIRGHFLIHDVLGQILIREAHFSDDVCEEMKNLLLSHDNTWPFENELIQKLMNAFDAHVKEVGDRGATAKLWIQYFEMVALIKKFIAAERMGNWFLHIEAVHEMLPFFHASGHFLYAKSTHLYLQDSEKLEEKMSAREYNDFVKSGFFTIQRSPKFWSGIWSDMTIEQTLMRLMKCEGGLTRGRGIKSSVLQKWVLSMPVVATVCQKVEDYTNCRVAWTEQHTDLRSSRMKRDQEDLEKLRSWISAHYPFRKNSEIVSLLSGVKGDGSVNCFNSLAIGKKGIESMIGKNFHEISFKRGE